MNKIIADSIKYLSNGENFIIQDLISRQTLPKKSSEEIVELARQFEMTYQKLPKLGYDLVCKYKEKRISYGLNPGIVILFVGGGRVNGKPLSLESDLDLFIGVENPKASFFPTRERPYKLENTKFKQEIIAYFKNELIKKYKLEFFSERFQIWNWGETFDKLKQDLNLIPVAITGVK